jgi:excisionase family DNA binding protein
MTDNTIPMIANAAQDGATVPLPPRPTRPTPTALLIPDTEAAALAGIARSTLHTLRADGKWGPQAVRLGRALRFRRDEVVAWIEAGCPDARTWAAMRSADGRRRRAN